MDIRNSLIRQLMYSDQCGDCLMRACSLNMSFFYCNLPNTCIWFFSDNFRKWEMSFESFSKYFTRWMRIDGSEGKSLPQSPLKFHTETPSLGSYVCLTSLCTSSGGDRAKHTFSQNTALICVIEHMGVCIITHIGFLPTAFSLGRVNLSVSVGGSMCLHLALTEHSIIW